jgi:hypothetical protein
MMLKIERILESGKTRLHLSGELRSSDIEDGRAEIEKIYASSCFPRMDASGKIMNENSRRASPRRKLKKGKC